MTKKMKISILVSAVILFLASLLALCYFVIQIPLFDASGWYTNEAGQKMYLDYFGKPRTHWVQVEEQYYYFDERTCAMHTGWLTLGDHTYFLGSDGAARTGWMETEKGFYYFNPASCAMARGWIVVGGKTYYMKPTGLMATGWMKSGDDYYYLGEDGSMQTGWLETEKGKYYLDEEGRRQVSWVEVDGKRYFFNVDGTMRTGWLYSGQGTYFLTESGAAHTGWITTDQRRMYMLEDGKAATGTVTVDGIERYFLKDGTYIPLVNQNNKVPADYEIELVDFDGFLVDQTCRDALEALMAAGRAEGHTMVINSAYRDEEMQKRVYQEYIDDYMADGFSYEDAKAIADKYVAVPGTSEHHLGLAIDFGNWGTVYDWLAENAWRYGWILRYIKDDGTVAYEPWHYRYVGKELAKELQESKLILEKYLEAQK